MFSKIFKPCPKLEYTRISKDTFKATVVFKCKPPKLVTVIGLKGTTSTKIGVKNLTYNASLAILANKQAVELLGSTAAENDIAEAAKLGLRVEISEAASVSAALTTVTLLKPVSTTISTTASISTNITTTTTTTSTVNRSIPSKQTVIPPLPKEISSHSISDEKRLALGQISLRWLLDRFDPPKSVAAPPTTCAIASETVLKFITSKCMTSRELAMKKADIGMFRSSIINNQFPDLFLEIIADTASKERAGLEVFVSGSLAAGLALCGSDIDLVVAGSNFSSKPLLRLLAKALRLRRVAIEMRLGARVPIIRATMPDSGTIVDISCSSGDAVVKSAFLSVLCLKYPLFAGLSQLLKLLAKKHECNDASCASFSSYALYWMAATILQVHCAIA